MPAEGWTPTSGPPPWKSALSLRTLLPADQNLRLLACKKVSTSYHLVEVSCECMLISHAGKVPRPVHV